jgi:hypothetical protein
MGVSVSGDTLRLARGVDRLERVVDQPLRAAHRARHVESTVEVAEVLRGLERLLERGLREAQGRAEALELAWIDVAHARIIAPALDRYAPAS